MKRCCPNSDCASKIRSSDSKWIKRFYCRRCNTKFSNATFDPAYKQKKRRENIKIKRLLCSGVSIRRSAIILGINRKTVARKKCFLGQMAREALARYWQNEEVVDSFQFDDLQTTEHTKCKPLSVTVAVDDRRKIMGLKVSSMPATGLLAKISRKKYGHRKDDRKEGIAKVLESIQPYTQSAVRIASDEHLLYPAQVKKYFPQAKYKRYKGAKGTISGQGELKKLRYDPLFKINHTLAMLRANINRLFRRTWCTTKDPKRLEDHLFIYAQFHNEVLTA